MDGIFITGTDTGVGKTTISAGIVKLLHASKPVAYWKPVQTGTVIGDDTNEVRELTELKREVYLEPGYRFAEPVAPFIAARHFGREIDLQSLVEFKNEQQKAGKFLVVEGAGGLLVPLTKDALLLELVRQFRFPVIIVAANKLGTINQTLLTIQACRQSEIEVLGVILTKSRQVKGLGNAECIERYGQTKILGEFSESSDRKAVVSQVSCDNGLRKLFGVPALPQ